MVFVPVAFVQTRLANEDGAEPVRTREVAVTDPKLAEVEETVPNWAFWANRLVVVTEVPVASVNARGLQARGPCRGQRTHQAVAKVPFEARTEGDEQAGAGRVRERERLQARGPGRGRVPTVEARACRSSRTGWWSSRDVEVTSARTAFQAQRRRAKREPRRASGRGGGDAAQDREAGGRHAGAPRRP